jgi:hypothetical protein
LRSAAWHLVGALLLCTGLAMTIYAIQPPQHDDHVTIVRKAPKPPECPDCGIATVRAEQE